MNNIRKVIEDDVWTNIENELWDRVYNDHPSAARITWDSIRGEISIMISDDILDTISENIQQ